jgi:2-polyprenyl-6-methoxyphenol hydroxylase-like FAD-dependent oxidoreductase
MPDSAQPSIAIVGGSIAGPALALRLAQEGFDDVHLYEASREPTAQTGGVLTLEHAALGVLDTIGVPQEEIIPFPSERIVSIKIADGQEADRFHTIYPGRHTAWHLINNSMMSRLQPDTLHTGARVTGLSIGPDDRPVLEFRGGGKTSTDLVVFADGRRSIGRSILDPNRKLEYSGIVAWRGQSNWRPQDLTDYTRFEPTGTRVAVFPTIQPNGSLGTDWTFYIPMTDRHFAEVCGGPPEQRSFVLPHQVSAQAKELVMHQARQMLTPDAVQMMEATLSWAAAPLLNIPPPRRMVFPIGNGHAVLIGDALAPVSPLTGRGANNGIEQADSLAVTLVQSHRYGADQSAALQGWQRRTLPAVRFSLEIGPTLAQRLGLPTHDRAAAAKLRTATAETARVQPSQPSAQNTPIGRSTARRSPRHR